MQSTSKARNGHGHASPERQQLAAATTGKPQRRPGASQGAADLALMQRVQQGDRNAFDILVLKYQHRIVKLAQRYVGDSGEALDVAQETFLRAFRSAGTFRGDSAFYTWLYRIASNTAQNHLIRMKRRSHVAHVDPQETEQSPSLLVPQNTDTPEGLALAAEIRDTVIAALNDLPEVMRRALILNEIEGWAYADIAAELNCPKGTVRSRIFRAREAISARLEPLLG